MWAVALILLMAIYLAAAAYKIVPPDSVGLIERMGRLMPGVRKPGVVFIRPFIEALPNEFPGLSGDYWNLKGRALLRDHSPAECLSDLCEVSNRLSRRLDWHARHVGLEGYSLNITGFDLPRKEMERVRFQAEAKHGRGDDGLPS